MIKKYVVKGIRKRFMKFLFLVISVSVGVATVVGILSLNMTMDVKINTELEKFGANMVIYPKSESFSLSYGSINIGTVTTEKNVILEEDLKKIDGIKNRQNIKVISPKVVGEVKIGENDLILVGINFTNEKKIKTWWIINGEIPKNENEILIGHTIFKNFNFNIGDNIILNKKNYKISGFLNQTGGDDDNVVFIDLKKGQFILDKAGEVDLVDLRALCNTCPIEEIIRQIEEVLSNVKATALKQLVNAEMSIMSNFNKFASSISVFVLLLSVISVFSTISSSVNEKTKEIGILRAVGFKRKDISKIIIYEILFISILAGVLGTVFGNIFAIMLGKLSLNVESGFNLLTIPWAFGISLFVCVISGIFPAFKASKIDVVQALRSI